MNQHCRVANISARSVWHSCEPSLDGFRAVLVAELLESVGRKATHAIIIPSPLHLLLNLRGVPAQARHQLARVVHCVGSQVQKEALAERAALCGAPSSGEVCRLRPPPQQLLGVAHLAVIIRRLRAYTTPPKRQVNSYKPQQGCQRQL